MSTPTLLTPPAPEAPTRTLVRQFIADYGMLGVLLLIALFFTLASWGDQYRVGRYAASEVIGRMTSARGSVIIAAEDGDDGKEFVSEARVLLARRGVAAIEVLNEPKSLSAALTAAQASGHPVAAILATDQSARWLVLQDLASDYPGLASVPMLSPRPYRSSTFLTPKNLSVVADRIVVIAIIAIGMTMVIITGGIDLSVGSLIAFSAVIAARLIRDAGGAQQASATAISICCAAAMGCCMIAGVFSGVMVTLFRIPPFIATLSIMLMGSGMAYITADSQSINQIPETIDTLGRGRSLLGIANTALLMIALYIVAQIVMTRTLLGRYIYAIGGNRKAAQLSGVPVKRVIVTVYAISGLLAGLGGVIETSRLKSGAPTYGLLTELYVIAAVVVGGTSLTGGRGKIFGTLIGAFIIAVIQNGMNLTRVGPHAQQVVLGAVILGAVTLDMMRNRSRITEA